MKNIKSAYNNNDEFDLPDGSYSIVDIQHYFEYIIKNTKLYLKILLYKFTQIKSKQNYFQSKNKVKTRIIIFRNDEIIRDYKKRC